MRRAPTGAGLVRLEVTHGGDAVYGEDYGAASPAVLGCAAEALGDGHLVSYRLERERRIGDFEVLPPRGGCGRASFEARAPLES